jgi:hypothetical protein
MGPSGESYRPRADLPIYIVGTEDVGKLYCCCSTFCEILAVDPLNFTYQVALNFKNCGVLRSFFIKNYQNLGPSYTTKDGTVRKKKKKKN